MAITPADVKKLRQETGVGMMEAKRALESSAGDLVQAVEHLRKAGKKIAAAKSTRAVKEGVVGTYVHADGKVAAMVALACETDFVALTEDFKNLAHDIAIHVAAMNPPYLSMADVPAELVIKEEEICRAQLKGEGKPEAMWSKIIPGKMAKFYAEQCLMNQIYVKDDSLTIAQLIEQTVARIGENVKITNYSRLAI